MGNYKDYRAVVFLIGGLLFTVFLYYIIKDIPEKSCRQKEIFARELSIVKGGIVIKKLHDAPNHNYETVRYIDSEGQKETTVFVFEKSGCYSYLQERDSIFKDGGSFVFRISHQGKDTSFILNYGCKK
jgi:hypothetical protein